MPLPTRPGTAAPAGERPVRAGGRLGGAVAAVVLGVVAAGMSYSVPRYRTWIVVVYAGAGLLLALRLVRDGGRVRLDRVTGALALLVGAVVTVTVPTYTYVPADAAARVRLALAVAAALAAAVLLVPRRWAPDVALLVAALGYTASVAAVIRLDPAPAIDVWYTLQGAADALRSGVNVYEQVWIGPPGPMQSFTYLPWTGVLVAPGRWLLGDVRWALLVTVLLVALAVRALGRRATTGTTGTATGPATRATAATAPTADGDHGTPVAAAAAAAVLLLLPGTTTQAEQAWTEPLLLACLAGAVVALRRGRGWLAVILVALALASKQHIAVLLPVLAVWHGFGLRRAAAAGVVAAGLVAPWFLTAPAAMWHDTVSYLVDFPALKFSNTLYVLALNDLGWSPPFWLTGVAVLGTLAAVLVVVHRRRPGAAEVLRWCALVLLVANLVNKQAFYNQFWLVLALVVTSWALPQDEPAPAGDGGRLRG